METTFIYSLVDPNTNEIRYIGKSNNPNKRLYDHIHSCNLTHTHKNIWIKSLIKENKKPIVNIIQEVPINEWEFYEKYWINEYRNKGSKLTNLEPGGNGLTRHTYNTKERMKLRHIEHPNYNKCKDKHYIIDKEELYQKYIVENLSINECVKYFNIPQTTIYRNLKEYKIKKDKSIWVKQCANPSRNIIKNVVLKYDLDFNLIGEFLGLKEAAKSVNKNDISGISECCNGKSITAHNYIWRYKNEEIPLDINKVKNRYSYHAKPVYQYTKQGLFVQEYNSITEAAIENNLTRSAISSCCNGRSKSCNGYSWNYYKL